MKRVALISVFLLLAACGGSKMELNNGTGMDLETVTLTIGEQTRTWNSIDADETFSSDILPADAASPVLLEWETNGQTWSMEYFLIENASEAKRISILFAPDEISINYSF